MGHSDKRKRQIVESRVDTCQRRGGLNALRVRCGPLPDVISFASRPVRGEVERESVGESQG